MWPVTDRICRRVQLTLTAMAIDDTDLFSNEHFASSMKERRQARSLTHEQLSQLTKAVDPRGEGISRVALSRYETGASLPGLRELRLLAIALRSSLSQFVYGRQSDPMLPYRLELEMRIMERVNDMITAQGVVKDTEDNDPDTDAYKALLAEVRRARG